jgi:hypothetical protein
LKQKGPAEVLQCQKNATTVVTMFGRSFQLPSGYVKIAMENGSFIDVVPIKMVIFKGFLYVYQRVSPSSLSQGLVPSKSSLC